MSKPFEFSNGSREAKLAIVGEAWGKNEALLRSPFVGWSGLELARVLHEAEILPEPPPTADSYSSTILWQYWKRQPVFLTNTFALQPDSKNNIEALCASKRDVGADYALPPFRQGKYFRPEFLPEVERLREELESVSPNLVLALGNTATWAILKSTKITSIRGAITQGVLTPGLKVLPTFHPSAVLRDWSLRVILLADCLKAKREMASPAIVRPERYCLVDPTIQEVVDWTAATLVKPPERLGCDIETVRGQIEMVSFAPSRGHAIVVPFVDKRKPGWSYWDKASEELRAWLCVNSLLASPIPKLFQNGVYDIQYFARDGYNVQRALHDTMLLHHSLYPELPKGLGFLGSLYSNEASWKLMRGKQQEELKADE